VPEKAAFWISNAGTNRYHLGKKLKRGPYLTPHTRITGELNTYMWKKKASKLFEEGKKRE